MVEFATQKCYLENIPKNVKEEENEEFVSDNHDEKHIIIMI